MKTYTISQTATMLNVTTVRIHGLLKAGKLELSDEAVKQGNKFVKGVTEESIANLQLARQLGRQGGSRQYIITLDESELADLTEKGFELKPRFVKKVQDDEE